MLIESWGNFTRYYGGIVGARDCFELACQELIQKENTDKEVHRVSASRGDGGIDVYVGNIGQECIDVYQCKFFIDKLDTPQWQQIKKSFERVIGNDKYITENWYLCLPKTLTLDENIKFYEFKNCYLDCSIEIHLIDGDQLLTRMKDAGISEKWFQIVENRNLTNPAPKVCPEFLFRTEINYIINNIRNKDEHQLLWGIGGIGKTTILKKIYSILKDEYDCVAWVEYTNNLMSDFINATNFGVGDRKQFEKQLLCSLNKKKKQRNLVFVDNVNELYFQDKSRKVIEQNATLVITSRIPEIVGYNSYEIPPFSREDGLKLFEKYYGRELNEAERNLNKILFDKISGNTLLIELVARAAKREFMPFDIFINKIVEDGVATSNVRIQSGHDVEKSSIIGHLQNLYNLMELGEENKRILFNFIVVPDNGVEFRFTSMINAKHDILEDLIEYGWIYRKDWGFAIHPLIKESIKLQCKDFRQYASDLIKSLSNRELTDINEKCINMYLYTHILLSTLDLIELNSIEEIYIYYNILKNSSTLNLKAIIDECGGQALEELENFCKDDNYYKIKCDILNEMALGYIECRVEDKAIECLINEIKILQEKLPDNEKALAACFCNIGMAYSSSDYSKALEYYNHSLELEILYYGDNSLEVADVYHNIGVNEFSHGDCDKAFEHLKCALSIRRNYEADIYIAHTLFSLGNVLKSQIKNSYDYEKAVLAQNYYLEALTIYQKIWGENYPKFQEMLFPVADFLHTVGNIREAIQIYIVIMKNNDYLGEIYPKIIDCYLELNDYINWQMYTQQYLDWQIKKFGVKSEFVNRMKKYIEEVTQHFNNVDLNEL